MKKTLFNALKILVAVIAFGSFTGCASLNLERLTSAGVKVAQAQTISDEQMAAYVKASVAQMDAQNPVAPASSAYTKRLKRLTAGIEQADGIPLNFKVYNVRDVNAFACPDGSVRVFAGLMDIMNDDELMGIIGHEIGHVLMRHSKNAFKNQLMTSALRDGIASTGGVAAALTDSQLGDLGETLLNARYSKNQEREADDIGYDFLVLNKRNPWGMVMAFEKFLTLEQKNGQQNSYITKMFSSHPDTRERISRMAERAQKEGIARPK